jgi:hypothetical protein
VAITFGDIERFVYDRLGIDEPAYPLKLRTKSMIVTEHRRLAAENELTVTQGTLATVAADPLVTLPADFMRLKAAVRGKYRMFPVGPDEFAEKYAVEQAAGSSDTGDNSLFFMFEPPLRLRLSPTPTVSAAAAITVWYVYRPVAMTASTDVPDGLYDEWVDCLIERVVYRMARQAGRPEIMDDAKVAADEYLARMQASMPIRQNDTNRVPIDGYGIR